MSHPTIFKDALTPAEVGDTVQFILDAKTGLPLLGPELINDGNFNGGSVPSEWKKGNGQEILTIASPVTAPFDTPHLLVDPNGSYAWVGYELTGLTIGEQYFVGAVNTFSNAVIRTGSPVGTSVTTMLRNGSVEGVFFTAPATTVYIAFGDSNGGRIDGLTCKHAPGRHFVQGNTSLMFTRRQDGSGNNYFELDGVDDVMEATFPDGFAGEVFVGGVNGCWVESDVAVAAGGKLSVGPIDGPSTTNLIKGLGDDLSGTLKIIEYLAREGSFSTFQKRQMADIVRARGGKGLLVPGNVLMEDHFDYADEAAFLDNWSDTTEHQYSHDGTTATLELVSGSFSKSFRTFAVTPGVPLLLEAASTGRPEVWFDGNGSFGTPDLVKGGSAAGPWIGVPSGSVVAAMVGVHSSTVGAKAALGFVRATELVPEEDL